MVAKNKTKPGGTKVLSTLHMRDECVVKLDASVILISQ
jgi:hypothetical protein